MRGATILVCKKVNKKVFQSTLPVRGATPSADPERGGIKISIHAPREGSDFFRPSTVGSLKIFQSTLPVRGATVRQMNAETYLKISIHAPREGSDQRTANISQQDLNFNPRSP